MISLILFSSTSLAADIPLPYGPFSRQNLQTFPDISTKEFSVLGDCNDDTEWGASVFSSTNPDVLTSADPQWNAFCNAFSQDLCMENLNAFDDAALFPLAPATLTINSTCTDQKPAQSGFTYQWAYLEDCTLNQYYNSGTSCASLNDCLIMEAQMGHITGWFRFHCPGGVCESEPDARWGTPSFTVDKSVYAGSIINIDGTSDDCDVREYQ